MGTPTHDDRAAGIRPTAMVAGSGSGSGSGSGRGGDPPPPGMTPSLPNAGTSSRSSASASANVGPRASTGVTTTAHMNGSTRPDTSTGAHHPFASALRRGLAPSRSGGPQTWEGDGAVHAQTNTPTPPDQTSQRGAHGNGAQAWEPSSRNSAGARSGAHTHVHPHPHAARIPPPTAGSSRERDRERERRQHARPDSLAPPPSPPKAARARFASESTKPRMTRFREMMYDLVQQMSMTPRGTTTTGTTDSGSAMTPSELEAGTAGTAATSVTLGTAGTSTTRVGLSGTSADGLWPGRSSPDKDGPRSVSWTRRSWRGERDGIGHGGFHSFSTADNAGSGSCSRRERRRQQQQRKRRSSGSGPEDEPAGPLSYVVVDNSFDAFIPDDADMDAAEKHLEDPGDTRRHAGSLDGDVHSAYTSYLHSDTSSRARLKRRRTLAGALNWWKTAVWFRLTYFVNSSFPDPKVERAFRKEEWYANKHAAILATMFLVLHWAVTIAVQPSLSLWRQYAYLGICGLWTLPLPLLVAFDGPLRFKHLYQVWVAGACWCWGWVLTVEMYSCGFYRLENHCGGRPFLHLLASLLAIAGFAVMSLGQNRGLHLVLATIWFATGSALFLPLPKTPMSWWRDVIVFELFHVFLSIMCFFRERSDRQLFSLRAQLKDQYRAVQSAQVQERRAEDSKKRFVSYIFHEVRVPLNTARLALANLDGEGAFHEMSSDQKELVIGLDGSLRMMEKVLNDVLSFNRMESGNLIQARKPFDLHKAVHYVALSHRATAELTGLEFELELDPRIDEVGGTIIGDEMRFKQVCSNLVSNAFKFTASGGVKVVTKLLFPVLPECEVAVEHVGGTAAHDTTPPTGDESTTVHDSPPGPVDEDVTNIPVLLRDTNFPGSATSSEGRTKRGSAEDKAQMTFDFADTETPAVVDLSSPALGATRLPQISARRGSVAYSHGSRRGSRGSAPSRPPTAQQTHPHTQTQPAMAAPAPPRPRKALIRVEVHDTGVGLSLSDVRDNRLFSPYVQTEIGRRQGGKGSGLGLALVMQIVKLSQGRLGVDSELGKGSVFWFEIPYTLSPHPSPQPLSQPQWLDSRRVSTPSPRGSISITIAGTRRRSAPDIASWGDTSALPSIGIGGSSCGPKSRGASPRIPAPLFNLLPFSSAPLDLGPSTHDQSPMTRAIPLVPSIPAPRSLPDIDRERADMDWPVDIVHDEGGEGTEDQEGVELRELGQKRSATAPCSSTGHSALPSVTELDLRNDPPTFNGLGISNPFVNPFRLVPRPGSEPRPESGEATASVTATDQGQEPQLQEVQAPSPSYPNRQTSQSHLGISNLHPNLDPHLNAPIAQRRHHASLLGRTPSLVPYQVPRMTQSPSLQGRARRPLDDPSFRPVIPDSPPPGPSLPILPSYPSTGSESSPRDELAVNPLGLEIHAQTAAHSGTLHSASDATTTTAGAEQHPPAAAATPPEPLTVLVVDDDALTRKLMARMLKRLGHTVVQASNGKIALDMILSAAEPEESSASATATATANGNSKGCNIDIVFLDNQMPLMTGVEVARAVRAHKIGTYIVGCTGNALREDQDEYLVAGADDIIPKPVSANAIGKRLEEARRRKKKRELEKREGRDGDE